MQQADGTSVTAVEAAANPSGGSPPKIPSRSLQRLVATWDASREKEVLVLSVNEALTTVKHYASAERWAATERLYELLSVAGNTRRKASVMNLRESVALGNAVEGEIAKWEAVERRCDQLMHEVQEFVGLFPDKYLNFLKQLVREVAAAQWDLGPPHPSPWDSVKSIFVDAAEVSALAAEDVAAAQSHGSFVAVEAWEWSSAPCRRPGEHVPSTRKLNVSCVAVDNTEATLTTVFIGTKMGDVISFPIELMQQQQQQQQQGVTSTGGSVPQGGGVGVAGERPQSANTLMGSSIGSLDVTQISAASDTAPSGAPPPPATGLIHIIHQLLQTRNAAVRKQVHDVEQLSPSAEGVRVFQGHRYEVLDLSVVSYNGADYEKMKLIVSCAADKVVRVSNVATGALIGIYSDSTSIVPNAVYFPLLNCLVQGSFDGAVEAWDFRTSTLIASLVELQQPITQVHMLAPSHGSARSTGMLLGTRKGHIYKITINVVELAGTDRRRIDTQRPVTFEFGLLGDPTAPLPSELSPVNASPTGDEQPPAADSRRTSSHSSRMPTCEYSVRVEHADTQRSSSYPPPASAASSSDHRPTLVLGGHMHAIVKMATLGPFLFSADSSGKIVQWDLERRLFVRKFHSHTDAITSLVVTGDGFLFSSSLDGLVCAWSVTNGQLLSRINRHFNVVTGVILGYQPIQRAAPPTSSNGSKKNSLLLGALSADSVGSATPGTTPLSVSPTATSKKRKSLVPPTAGSGGGGNNAVTSAAGGSKSKGNKSTSSSTTSNIFPEVPMAFRKSQGGARECVTLDVDRKAATSGGPAMKMSMVSFAQDESAIAWDITVDRATTDLGATFLNAHS